MLMMGGNYLSRRGYWFWAFALIAACVSCKKESEVILKVKVPHSPGALAPSFAQLALGESYNATVNDDIEMCGTCHGEHVKDWRLSTHAFSSFNNPLYRVAFDDYVTEEGIEKGAFCGGCHDPSLLFAGALEDEVSPLDNRGHIGISCNGCHGIDSITFDGVGSYRLSTAPIPVPKENDPQSLKAHIQRVSKPVLKTNEFCITCHRGFLSQGSGHDVFVAALDEYGPWRRSPYAGTESRFLSAGFDVRSCVDCHMPKDQARGGMHSHRFAGGHTTLAAMLGDSKQQKAQESFLRGRVSIDVPVWGVGRNKGVLSSEEVKASAGDTLWLDVVVTNKAVGHQYPGGARDLRNAWLEVELYEQSRGRAAVSMPKTNPGVPTKWVHKLHVGMLDEDGKLVDTHDVSHFRTAAYDHTIAPYDSRTVRYEWSIPKNWKSAGPWRVVARVVQKRLSDEFYQRVCAESKRGRGAQFVKQTETVLGQSINPCAEQPKTTMDEVSVDLGRAISGGQAWRRWYRHGLGLRHGVQEKMSLAAASLKNALDTAPPSIDSKDKARILSALAEVTIRQGRAKQALELVQELEAILGDHPLVLRLRGQAFSVVWESRKAGGAYKSAAEKAPLDDGLWRMAAMSYGSNSDYKNVLPLALRGLELEPRDTDLLRLQMIGIKRLNGPYGSIDKAEAAFIEFRSDERGAARKARCSRLFAECRLEREPFHTHELESVFEVGKGAK